METLNTDCLSRIFLNLNFIERVRLENVCRIWYSVLQKQSTFSDTFRLNIAQFLINNTTEYYQQESISFAPTVMGVVERCGLYVRDLTFGQRWLKISQDVTDCIAYNCPNLCVVDFGAVILNADISPLLEVICENLEDFSLEETSWVNIQNAKKVQMFFPRMKRLKSLNLRSAMFELDHLAQVPPNLRFLDISGGHRFSEDVLLNFLRSQIHLDTLHMSPAPIMSQNILDAISRLPKIKTLDIGYVDQQQINYAPLQNLTTLQHLRLTCLASLNEDDLSQILRDVQLKHLLIKRCRSIRDYSALDLCTQLTSLEICDTMQLADEDWLRLGSYGKLKKIALINCLNVGNRALRNMLNHCQLNSSPLSHIPVMCLLQFCINKCPDVTDDILYVIANTQFSIEFISVQGCGGITSMGVSALAWLRNVSLLKELDVSRNRRVNDSAVLHMYNALNMAERRAKMGRNDYEEDELCAPEKQLERPKLVMYIFDTSITGRIEDDVSDYISIC